jgi:ppGpp synthetase/RelA/SpoT-type nucleotidyltranferase
MPMITDNAQVDLSERRPWSKRDLRRLGEALVEGSAPPAGCPQYDDVMIWHNDLAAAVKAELQSAQWRAFSPASFDATARSKTHDTLVQKAPT